MMTTLMKRQPGKVHFLNLTYCGTLHSLGAEFSYLVEEKILRLLAYFKDHRLNLKFLSHLAEQLGVPPPVILEFAKWKAQREVDHLRGQGVGILLRVPLLSQSVSDKVTTFQGTPQAFQHSVSPVRLTPATPGTLGSPDIGSVKMEVDEGVASLPTPQPSVAMSPSPSRTQSIEPDSTYMSFYDTWLNERAAPLEPISLNSTDAPLSSVLQRYLSPSVARFAVGPSNAS